MIEKASKNPSDPVLSFEEFSARGDDGITPRYVNFNAYFGNGMAGDIYRDTPQFQKLAGNNPKLAEELCAEVTETVSKVKFGDSTYRHLIPMEPKMHEAYVIMRGEGFSDAELFC